MTSAPPNPVPQAATAIEQDPRWTRILARDKTADGQFWYSVVTTGVYCRPSCPSRTCNPRNVTLHDTLAEARATGFRPCRRCRPDETAASAAQQAVARACRLIEAAEDAPSLNALAASVGVSPSHFHRTFKAMTGVTPRAYADARRATRLRDGLGASRTVTEAIFEAGFNSSGRFYEQSDQILGMTPTRYRAGGEREEIRFAVGPCSLGAILVASSARGVAAILIGNDPGTLLRDLQDRFPKAHLIGGDAAYEALVARVVGFVEAPRLGLDLPLDVRGTAFQQRVWQALRAIPPGETASYAEIARRIGAPGSARAVAGACAANRLAVAIPCHRVVRTDGDLSGYRWGIARKRSLLEREAASHQGPAPPGPGRA
jgi:AraC family transcriptional regulator, regulatory protein of adaptative response / methylated-DNA-[protein]-cysteine methyltransferase